MSKGLAVCIALLAAGISGCGDECSKYSDYSCKQLEKADYNVYVYLPGDREKYGGRVTGLHQCADVADAVSSEEENRDGWSYVCCLITDDSSCAEKHR